MSQYDVRAGLAAIEDIDIVGISIITTNENDTAASDINTLWERFFKESIGQVVPGKMDDTIYAVYSDYEGDHTAPYRLTIGYRVQEIGDLPPELYHVKIQAGDYALLSAAGPQPRSLIDTWEAIWSSDLTRQFKTDFEIYGPRFFEDGINEVLIHVGVVYTQEP